MPRPFYRWAGLIERINGNHFVLHWKLSDGTVWTYDGQKPRASRAYITGTVVSAVSPKGAEAEVQKGDTARLPRVRRHSTKPGVNLSDAPRVRHHGQRHEDKNSLS